MSQFQDNPAAGGWFSNEMLARAVEFAKKEDLFTRLNALYQSIPEGECSGCAACCMESVETHWLEFLQIYEYLQARPELLQKLLPGMLRFYLLEGAEKSHCPFQVENRRCAIYPVRPLPCRLFGQWGEKDYEKNYRVTHKANQNTANYYHTEYQLTLPPEVINHKVPYCEKFKKPRNLNKDDFYDLLDGIMALQSRFLMEDLIDEELTSLGLISWWTGVYFDLDKLQDLKTEIMRDYLQNGRSDKLAEFLNHKTGL